MGADGHIVIARRGDWDAANPDVKPNDIGLYTGTVLGVEACWGYYGDNLFEPNYLTPWSHSVDGWHLREDDGLPPVEARKEAARWFAANSESHEVWT